MSNSEIFEDDPEELDEWLEAFKEITERSKPKAKLIVEKILEQAQEAHIELGGLVNTPYINTIEPQDEPPYPGDLTLEKKLRALIRWNAMAMVIRANKAYPNIGGHLATYASCATLYEVGFNHFFKGGSHPLGQDHIFFQGHASPGIYARSFLEYRLDENKLDHFRREVADGLSSYPHPLLMPSYWQFSTVSMGLGPLLAAHQAYIDKFLTSRNMIDASNSKTWCFCGDGELDEPEANAAIQMAGREKLDNLIFVVNANLQRLDGPVRGNGKIIQELEARFNGAGWHVIKVIWGSKWDALLAKDKSGLLKKRMQEALDGDYQKYAAEGGSYIREHFFGAYPELLEMVKDLSDEELSQLPRGGHDLVKVYAAYDRALKLTGAPVAIIAKTVKGWALGPKIEARNAAHAAKSLDSRDLIDLKNRLSLGEYVKDEELTTGIPPYIRPPIESPEISYMLEHRKKLGGFIPERQLKPFSIKFNEKEVLSEFYEGSKGQAVSTTQVLARILRNLVKTESLKDRVIPIVPDEARSFGLESLFPLIKIYSQKGQRYVPVDAGLLISYQESEKGQILEEGISEADGMASFCACATSWALWGEPLIPFYLFYSMFGFQRVGDLIWAASDMRANGFLIGTTAGRTAYNGEGLQHQDGHSHLYALSVPSVKAYDPAFAYELAAVIEAGIEEFLDPVDNSHIYYITTYNENYPMPRAKDSVSKEEILKGLYLFEDAPNNSKTDLSLWFSGPLFQCATKARQMLFDDFGLCADLWSVPSVKTLRENALEVQRENELNLTSKTSYLEEKITIKSVPIVAVSDFVRATFDTLSPFVLKHVPFASLGTEGFGRSDTRESLRDFFEIDERYIVLRALSVLGEKQLAKRAIELYNIDKNKAAPFII